MRLTKTKKEKIQKTLKKYRKKLKNGCFGWKGSVKEGSRPSIYVEGIPIGAHRGAWMVEKGHIPYGYYVLQSCDNKSCTNVDHLYLSTKKVRKKTETAKKRPGVERLALNIPIYLMVSIKEMARKYNQTVTQFVIKRLNEIITFEKKVDNKAFYKKKHEK